MKIINDTVAHLCIEIGQRPPGSLQEKLAAEYIKNQFSKAGVQSSIETFKSPAHKALSSKIEFLSCVNKTEFISYPVQFSPSGVSEGKLLVIDRKAAEGKDLSGCIGLWAAEGEEVTARNIACEEMQRKGLEGLIIVGRGYESINTKIIRTENLQGMPAVTVSASTGYILSRYEGENVRIEVKQETSTVLEESSNVVARIPGKSNKWLFIGAHYDTSPFSPGAADNAGGTAVLMGIAELMKDMELPVDVFLVAFGSEEHGGLDGTGRGPWDFLERRRDIIENCIGFLNIDEVGNIFGNPRFYAGGPGRFRESILKSETVIDYLYAGKTSPTGDFGPVEMEGIPYAWFTDSSPTQGAIRHTPEDTLDKIEVGVLETYAHDMSIIVKALFSQDIPHPVIWEKGVIVRQAKHRDIENICEITSFAFGPVSINRMQQEYFGEKLGGKNWDFYKNRSLINSCKANIYNVIVAEEDGKVVGYATYGFDEEKGIASISNNAVLPERQGRGIGKLMQAEVDRRIKAEGYEKFGVSTLSIDIPAQKIYEKLGYERLAESIIYVRKQTT